MPEQRREAARKAAQARWAKAMSHNAPSKQQRDRTRLGAVQSRIAVLYCLDSLALRPEETEPVLAYFKKVALQPEEHEVVIAFLSGEYSLYDYQNYLILKFYFEIDFLPLGILAICRSYIRDSSKPHWLRAFAAAIIGQVREAADMEFFEAQYTHCRNEIERATCICSAAGMEIRRRNEFLGRAKRDGELEERACKWVRANTPSATESQATTQAQSPGSLGPVPKTS